MGRGGGDGRGRSQVVVFVGLALLLATCTAENDRYCRNDKACVDKFGSGYFCSTFDACELNDASRPAGAGGNKGSGGSGGTTNDPGSPEAGVMPNDIDASTTPTDADVDLGPAPECRTSDDCTARTDGNNVCVVDKCRPCDAAHVKGCPAERPFCSARNECVSCMARQMEDPAVCQAQKQICTNAGWCAECETFAECADAKKPLCWSATMPPGPKSCTPCGMGGGSPGCKERNPLLPICLTTGDCGECGVSADCTASAAKPICVASQCVPCTTDAQCAGRPDGPGVCLIEPDAKGGRCATEIETIYVGKDSCSDTEKGAGTKPFCSPQKAIDAITKDRRVVIVRGGTFEGFKIDKTGTPIWVIGLKTAAGDAVINPGGTETGIAVRNVNVDVRLRGLTVLGGADIGVRAEGANTIVRLNRCIVKDNLLGGFSATAGAGFDISNSVFDGNGKGGGGTQVSVGGVYLASMGGKVARFRASTVINNNGGVTCLISSNITLSGVLLWGNPANGCRTEFGSVEDPKFDPTRAYHLSPGSPCIGKLPSGSAPFDDLDGEPRAANMTDCGADEYKP